MTKHASSDLRGIASNDQPLVSIVIPCFNNEAYVAEAIDSALGQTYDNIEVIVVDDGSTDASLDIIRSYGNRITWRTGPNQGACAARNSGLNQAKGRYVQFLDADDLISSDKVAHQTAIILTTSSATALVAGAYCVAGPSGHSDIFLNENRLLSDPIAAVFGGVKRGITSANLWKVDKVRCVGGWKAGLAAGQETELLLRLLLGGFGLVVDNEIKTTIRHTSTSITRSAGKLRPESVSAWVNVRFDCAVELSKLQKLYYNRRLSLCRYLLSIHINNEEPDIRDNIERRFGEVNMECGLPYKRLLKLCFRYSNGARSGLTSANRFQQFYRSGRLRISALLFSRIAWVSEVIWLRLSRQPQATH